MGKELHGTMELASPFNVFHMSSQKWLIIRKLFLSSTPPEHKWVVQGYMICNQNVTVIVVIIIGRLRKFPLTTWWCKNRVNWVETATKIQRFFFKYKTIFTWYFLCTGAQPTLCFAYMNETLNISKSIRHN